VSVQSYRTRHGSAAGRHGKYHLEVTTRDVVDVVRHAGGWLYDRAMGGWDVTVLVDADDDLTPLRILGVRTERVSDHDDPADPTAPTRARAFAASAEAIAAHPRLHDEMVRELRRGAAEVTIWGDLAVTGLERGVDPVEHVLSAAARAFKTHALGAAGCAEAAGPVEVFRRRSASYG
jgi:hypothetical protein